MELTVDLHTHTIASNHAYCTIREMARMAAEKGVTLLGLVEHTPGVFGAPDPFYFMNLKVIPRELYGVKLMLGGELNITDYEGTLCLDESYWSKMDYRLAGVHSHCYESGTKAQNMNAVLSAIANPWVDILCHPDDGLYQYDYEAMVLEAKKYDTLLEVNNNALSSKHRIDSFHNAVTMLEYCKKHGVPVLLSSDAHFDVEIGRCEHTVAAVEAADFPRELIVNFRTDYLTHTLESKKRQRNA